MSRTFKDAPYEVKCNRLRKQLPHEFQVFFIRWPWRTERDTNEWDYTYETTPWWHPWFRCMKKGVRRYYRKMLNRRDRSRARQDVYHGRECVNRVPKSVMWLAW